MMPSDFLFMILDGYFNCCLIHFKIFYSKGPVFLSEALFDIWYCVGDFQFVYFDKWNSITKRTGKNPSSSFISLTIILYQSACHAIESS